MNIQRPIYGQNIQRQHGPGILRIDWPEILFGRIFTVHFIPNNNKRMPIYNKRQLSRPRIDGVM